MKPVKTDYQKAGNMVMIQFETLSGECSWDFAEFEPSPEVMDPGMGATRAFSLQVDEEVVLYNTQAVVEIPDQ